jgi:hypothetical protein
MTYTAKEFRSNIYRILDQVLETGVPAEIHRKGKVLKIVPGEKPSKLANLEPHPDYLLVDPEEIVHIDWSSEVNRDYHFPRYTRYETRSSLSNTDPIQSRDI